MSACACGKPADTIGGLCGRCAALQTLGLGMDASMAEVEGTYRTLVKVWHPDRFQTDLKLKKAAEEKLKEINAAHDYLAIGPVVEETQFVSEEPEPIPEAEPEEQDEEVFEAPEPVNEESRELKRVLKRYQRRTASIFFPGFSSLSAELQRWRFYGSRWMSGFRQMQRLNVPGRNSKPRFRAMFTPA